MLNKKGEEVTTYDFSGKFIVDFAFTSANAFYIYTIDSGAVVPVARVMSYNGDLAKDVYKRQGQRLGVHSPPLPARDCRHG